MKKQIKNICNNLISIHENHFRKNDNLEFIGYKYVDGLTKKKFLKNFTIKTFIERFYTLYWFKLNYHYLILNRNDFHITRIKALKSVFKECTTNIDYKKISTEVIYYEDNDFQVSVFHSMIIDNKTYRIELLYQHNELLFRVCCMDII